MSTSGPAVGILEPTLDTLGTPLHHATFLVLDLETTGGSAADSAITEIGAVLCRGGQVLGEFQTLVRPHVPIPAFVQVLTGITEPMVAHAPSLAAALASLREFAGWTAAEHPETVLVAHNAPFDVGFLRAAHERLALPWPKVRVLDTARLARAAFSREEVRDCKLGTLARFVGAGTAPDHRALNDARATVDVLHAIIGRVGNLGVQSVEELSRFTARVSTAQRRKRHLADGLPESPGVYVFRDATDTPLYIGVSQSIRSRVRTYFTASEQRGRMAEMVGIAARVTAIPCATDLEARVREVRLIGQYRPPYNRRSRRERTGSWLVVDEESGAVAAARSARGLCVGPFRSRDDIHGAAEVLSANTDIAAGVVAGSLDAVSCLVGRTRDRIDRLASGEHYEQAAVWRDRLRVLLRALDRLHRGIGLALLPEVVLAAPTSGNGWDLHLLRHGRLAGAAQVRAGVDPRPAIDSLLLAGEVVEPVTTWAGAAAQAAGEELGLVLRWAHATPGVRLARMTGAPAPSSMSTSVSDSGASAAASEGWSTPVGAAGPHLASIEAALAAPIHCPPSGNAGVPADAGDADGAADDVLSRPVALAR